jgi:hypothetical protein
MHGVSDRQDCYRSHEWGIVIDRIEVYRSVVRVEEGSRLTEFKVNAVLLFRASRRVHLNYVDKPLKHSLAVSRFGLRKFLCHSNSILGITLVQPGSKLADCLGIT